MKKGTGQQTLWQQWVQVGFIWSHCPTPTGAYNTIVLTRGKTIAHPYLMSEIQTLYAALNGKLRLLWSCYDGTANLCHISISIGPRCSHRKCNIQSCHEASPFSFFYGDKDHISEPEPVLAVPLGSRWFHNSPSAWGQAKAQEGGNVRDCPWLGLHMGLEQLPVDHWKSPTRECRAIAGEGIEYSEEQNPSPLKSTIHLLPRVFPFCTRISFLQVF